MAEAKKTKGAAPKAAPSSKKTTVAKKPAAAKKTAAKKPAAVKKPAAAKWSPGAQERYNMVQVAAYYIAERNGFSGDPLQFWSAAETQVAKMLAGQ